MSEARAGQLFFPLALLLFSSVTSIAVPLSDVEARGKQIYFSGTDTLGPQPRALLGSDSTPAPAHLAPCASCHGDDGAGRPEGVIRPPAISWRHLTQGLPQSSNRDANRLASDENFQQAVRLGRDAAGRRFDAIMPRYEFSSDQLRALIAYLKVIETDQAPGVAGDVIRIALILPDRGALASDLMARILLSYASELNARGGIFNRRLQLIMLDPAEQLGELLRKGDVFAILTLDTGEHANAVERIVDEAPVISLIDFWKSHDRNTARRKFSLFANDATQIRVMADYVAQHSPSKPPQIALLCPDDAALVSARNAIAEQSRKWHGPPPIEHAYDAARFDGRAAVSVLSNQGVDAVVFIGDGLQLATLITALKEVAWRPHLLILGEAASAALFDAPKDIAEKIRLAFPMLADDASKNASFIALQQANAIPRQHVASQLAAYCAAQILAQGLKLAGRELTREKFLTALESIRGYDAGLSHPIDFSPNQHVGAFGAYVVGIQPEERRFTIVNDWMAPQ